MTRWLTALIPGRRRKPVAPRPRIVLKNDFAALYAIGDVHGCLEQLCEIEEKILRDGAGLTGTKLIVLVGDYVDRGPSSAGVIEHLLRPLPVGFQRICLAGNHDQMFLDFIDHPALSSSWLGLGGDETLSSYGVYLDRQSQHQLKSTLTASIPQDHIEFIKSLPVMAMVGQYGFVHAGIDPRLSPDQQPDDILLNSRPHQFDWSLYDGKDIIIHGHTPVPEVEFSNSRINIDIKTYQSGRSAALRIVDSGMTVLLTG